MTIKELTQHKVTGVSGAGKNSRDDGRKGIGRNQNLSGEQP